MNYRQVTRFALMLSCISGNAFAALLPGGGGGSGGYNYNRPGGDSGDAFRGGLGRGAGGPSSLYGAPSGGGGGGGPSSLYGAPSGGGGGGGVFGGGRPSTAYGAPGFGDGYQGGGGSGGSGYQGGGGGGGGGYSGGGYDNGRPEPYSFHYEVYDPPSGNDYSQRESSDGTVVRGEYRVLLPDSRTQIVKYMADDVNGYNAEVQYEGQAQYPQTGGGYQGGGYQGGGGGGYPSGGGGTGSGFGTGGFGGGASNQYLPPGK